MVVERATIIVPLCGQTHSALLCTKSKEANVFVEPPLDCSWPEDRIREYFVSIRRRYYTTKFSQAGTYNEKVKNADPKGVFPRIVLAARHHSRHDRLPTGVLMNALHVRSRSPEEVLFTFDSFDEVADFHMGDMRVHPSKTKSLWDMLRWARTEASMRRAADELDDSSVGSAFEDEIPEGTPAAFLRAHQIIKEYIPEADNEPVWLIIPGKFHADGQWARNINRVIRMIRDKHKPRKVKVVIR